MQIIEIAPLDNGAHRNQSGDFDAIPEGWTFIPEELDIPDTFPFVRLEVDGQMVTGMTPGTVPVPEPVPTPVDPMAQLRADVDFMAAMTGVSL